MNQHVETPYIKMWKQDGILHAVYPEGIEVDRSIAQHIVQTRLKFAGDKSYPCLIDMRGIKSVNKEAREYLAKEGSQNITASCLIIGNPFTRTLAHIFLTVNKPKVPTMLFGDVEPAKKWLAQYAVKEHL